MQSKKRLTEINIWEAAWFMDLSSQEKLFYRYLNDRCDNVGVWDPNYKLAGFHLNIKDVPAFADSFLAKINQEKTRVKILECDSWFLIDFVRFQYCQAKPLNPKSPSHRSYLALMKERNLWEWFCKEQPEIMPDQELHIYSEINSVHTIEKGSKRPLKGGFGGYKDKDTEKDSDKGIDTDMDIAKDKDPLEGVDNDTEPQVSDEELFGKTSFSREEKEESAEDFERSSWEKKAKGTVFEN